MSQQILLTLNDTAGNALGQYNINTAGSALHIQAVDGAYYQFTDLATGIGPEGIITEREGDNLLVSFDEGTDLVIENYFTQSQPGALVGMQADGGLFSYPVATAPEHVLAEELAASQTLGSEQPVWAPLGVLGAVGLIAAGIGLANDDSGKGWDNGSSNSGGGGSGSGNNPSPQTPAPTPNNPSNPGNPSIPSPNPGNPGNPAPTPNPNPSPTPTPTPQPPTPTPQPGGDPKPIAKDDPVKGTPKEKVTIDVLDNDYGMDANGQRDLDPNSIRLMDAAGKPVTELTVAGQGKWNVSFGKVTFTPDANFTGNPTPVQYTVSDKAGQVSNKATITVTYDSGTPGGNTQGRAVITGEAKVGQTLSADINDPDGVPTTGVKYQWMADGIAIQGATGPTYTVSAADKGKAISLNISYTDNRGNPENISTPSTTKVVDGTPTPQPPQPPANHPGSVAISGNAKVGEKLTADVHDDDSVPQNINYQWLRDGQPIANATGKEYMLTADDEGKTIKVHVEYTDGAGHKESHDSAATANVAPSTSTNHAPTAINLDNNNVLEGKDGAEIGKLTTTDPDAGDQHTYKVSDERFEVTADGTLKLKAGQHLDYASEKIVNLQITSDDGHGGTLSQTFYLNVQDDPNYPAPNPQPPQPGNHPGSVSITGEAKVGSELKAEVKDADGVDASKIKYQWFANNQPIAGATNNTLILTAAQKGAKISVQATYKDNAQHDESPTSAQTDAVSDGQTPPPQPPQPPVNHPGSVAISGNAKVGEKLTADVHDDDSVPQNISYQWQRDGQAIAGANGKEYVLTADDAGKSVKVHVEYTDGAGHKESLDSAATANVAPPTSTNHAPTAISLDNNNVLEGKDGASIGKLTTTDPDAGDSHTYTVSDSRFEVNADGTLKLKAGQHLDYASEKAVNLQITSDDGHGGTLSQVFYLNVQDDPNYPAPNPQPPTPPGTNHEGKVSISGEAKVGQTLTALVSDADGVPANVRYQWLADGVAIQGAIGPTYTLTAVEKGKAISVRADYTDNAQHSESPLSDATAPVVDPGNPTPQPPQPPTNHEGTVSISGMAQVNETLTATVDDADGVPSDGIKYQWLRDGKPIDGETDKDYILTPADVGHKISVQATYKDNAQHDEAPKSAETKEVIDAPSPQPNPQPQPGNHEPVGTVKITGEAKVGQTLTASNDLKDDDGMGTVTYRWFADDKEVSTGESYTLSAVDKGKTISVKAEYTDGKGTAESVESAKTAEVADDGVTPPPQPQPPQPGNHEGFASINGNAKVGETLMATVTDSDNLATDVQYQWLRDGQTIDGATKQTYRLEAADEGKTISVQVEYTDGKGNHEVHRAQSAIIAPESATNHKPFIEGNFESQIMEGKNGLVLGKVSVRDEDADDAHTLAVNDSRFEITADGTLKLKDNQHLDYSVEKSVTVRITVDDGHGGTNSLQRTFQIQDDPNWSPGNPPQPSPKPQPNHDGTVSISGEAKVGSELKAEVKDDDGFDSAKVKYQWLRDGQKISGAEGETYKLTADDVGHKISVQATYKDNAQHDESPTSAQTDAVSDNTSPQKPNNEGTIAIDGIDEVGQTLAIHVYDEDGISNNTKITYQWLRGGNVIEGATERTYTLTRDDIGHHMSARASYIDDANHQESLQSSETPAVRDNLPPPPHPNREGSVAIQGVAKEHETLTAQISDGDSVDRDTITYQWLRDSNPIAQANGETYTLTADDVGHKISVQAFYKDQGNHAESPLSTQTDTIVDAQTTLPPHAEPPIVEKGQDEKQGGVMITPPRDASTLYVSYIHDDKEQNHTFILRPNGTWIKREPGALPSGAQFDEYSGRLRLAPSLLDDHTPVTASTVSNKIHSKTVVVETDSDSSSVTPQAEPTLFMTGDRAVTEGNSASYTLHLSKPVLQDVTATVRIEHVNTDDGNVKAEERTVTITKGQNALTLDVATFDNSEFQGGRSYRVNIVEAKGAMLHDSSKQIETALEDNDKPPVPKMAAGNEQGSVEITPVYGTDYLSVRYHDETDFDQIITLNRNKDGVWQRMDGTRLKELPEHVSLDAHSGKLTLGAKAVQDGYKVVAYNSFKGMQSEYAFFTADNNDGTSQHNRPGSIAIKGEAKVGVELSAEITDPDGVPDNVQYQWMRNGEKIDGATGSTYRLSTEDLGRKISVQATYEDNAKHSETPKSAETDAVSNDQLQPNNHAPTEITLSETLVDEAKEGAVVGKLTTRDPDAGDKHTYTVNDDRFEVTADGTLKLKAGQFLDHDKEPTLKLSITTDDGHGGVFTKDFTLRVQDDPLYPPINPNEDGTVTISGDHKVGSTLTAEVKDGDGVPSDGVKYQWLRDGNPIASATGKSYVLTAEDAGHKITVKAEYDDNAQNHETPVSQPTENIADNSAPLEHNEPQLQTADGAAASAADGLDATAHHSHGSDGHDVLIGDGIDAAAYSQLVSHQGEDLLQYLGQHSAELLAATRDSGSHKLHGGAGDDVLIAGHGATLLEGGAGADTFAYLLDSNDAAGWNEPSRILDFNPQEGDRIVLAGGDHVKAEVSSDADGQHLHVTDDAGHSRTIDIASGNGKTLTAEDILSHVEIRAPQSYSEPASSVPQTHHLPQDDHSHLI